MNKPLMLLIAGFSLGAYGQSPSVLSYGADPSGNADSTAAFNAAKAANPIGPIYVPVGSFKISTTLTFGLSEYLKGAGPGATVINCTMTTTPCIVFTGPQPANSPSGMSDLVLSGPGSNNVNSTGVYLGGDPTSAVSASSSYGNFVSFNNVNWSNFGSCVKWGNNAWLNGFSGGGMNGCAIGLNAPNNVANSGENIQVSRFVIYNGGTPISSNNVLFDFNIDSTSFDYNTSFISITGGTLHVMNSHFEQSSGAFLQVPYGSPIVDIQQSTFSLAASSGRDTDFFDLYPQAMQLVVNAADVYANHPVDEFVHTAGIVFGSIANLSGNGNRNVAAVVQSGSSQTNLHVQGFGGAPGAATFTNLTVTGTCTGCGVSGGSGFPITIGSTAIGGGSSTSTIAGLSLTAPALGTPSSINLTNATTLPCSAMPALTGVVTTTAGSCVTTLTTTTPPPPPTPVGSSTYAYVGGLGASGYNDYVTYACTAPNVLIVATAGASSGTAPTSSPAATFRAVNTEPANGSVSMWFTTCPSTGPITITAASPSVVEYSSTMAPALDSSGVISGSLSINVTAIPAGAGELAVVAQVSSSHSCTSESTTTPGWTKRVLTSGNNCINFFDNLSAPGSLASITINGGYYLSAVLGLIN